MNKKKILMIGPNLSLNGGMSTFIKSLISSDLKLEIDFRYISTFNGGNFLNRLLCLIKGIINFFRIIIFNRIDLVHIHTASYGSFRRKSLFYLISKLFRKSIIIHLHGGKFMEYYSNACKMEKKWIKHVLMNSDEVVVVAKIWEQQVKNEFKEVKVRTIYNPINVENYKYLPLNRDDEKINILFMARLVKNKGIFELIEIIPNIVNKHPEVMFYICGNGEVDKIKSLIKERHIENNVVLTGWVEGKEKMALFAKATIFIQPSYYESLGISIIEAMASSLPIIATSVGGIPELVKENENGLLVKLGYLNHLEAAITKMIEDGDLRLDYGKRSFELSMKFDIGTFVGKIRRLYNSQL